jgi:hypothetical protein
VEAEVIRMALSRAPTTSISPETVRGISSLEVVACCECGCASLFFTDVASNDSRIAEGVGDLADGTFMEFVVWARDGVISVLEFVDHQGSGQLPSPESIRPWHKALTREI